MRKVFENLIIEYSIIFDVYPCYADGHDFSPGYFQVSGNPAGGQPLASLDTPLHVSRKTIVTSVLPFHLLLRGHSIFLPGLITPR